MTCEIIYDPLQNITVWELARIVRYINPPRFVEILPHLKMEPDNVLRHLIINGSRVTRESLKFL